MASVSPAEVLTVVVRFLFVVCLYVFVGAALLTLRRALQSASHADRRAETVLALAEATPADSPVGRTVALDNRPLVIGRRPDCDVVLRDEAVSGRHARIAPHAEGWQLDDLQSTNGTYVNGRRIARPAIVRAGDEIRIGGTTWRVEERGV